jgi:HSP20 family protein
MKFGHIKENMSALWDNMAEGWRHLWQSAAGALTRFKPGEKTDLPDPAEVDHQLSAQPRLGHAGR